MHAPITLASFLLPRCETQPHNLLLFFSGARSPLDKCRFGAWASSRKGFTTAVNSVRVCVAQTCSSANILRHVRIRSFAIIKRVICLRGHSFACNDSFARLLLACASTCKRNSFSDLHLLNHGRISPNTRQCGASTL